jgi:hypothetical protein
MIGTELLRQRLQAGRDLGDFLHAVLVGALGGAGQQLEIVDDDHVEALLALQAPRARRKLGDRDAAGLVDEQRDFLQVSSSVDERRNSCSVMSPRRILTKGSRPARR